MTVALRRHADRIQRCVPTSTAWFSLLLLFLFPVVAFPAETESSDFGLTLPGYILVNSSQYAGPVFPIVPRSFSSSASNFAIDWNVATQWTVRESQTWDRSNRPFALVHIAQYQALRANFVLTNPVEPNALVAHASHIALTATFPEYKDRYDELLRQQTQEFSQDVNQAALEAAGIVTGNLLSERADDGSQDTVTSLPAPQGNIKGTDIGYFAAVPLGNYQGSLTNFRTFGGNNYQYANATPFVLPTPVTELPVLKNDPGPPDLESTFYDSNYKATFLLGRDNSTVRSRYQTESAYFWFQTADTPGFPGQWNQITLAHLDANISLADTITLLAQLAVTTYDTFIVVYSAKVKWQRWRPVTAIQHGDCHPGGPSYCHPPVPGWEPLLPTPNNPVYPSFIGGAAGAGESVLNSWFNSTDREFSIGSEAFTPNGRLVPRIYTSATQAALDCCNSRIYGGVELLPDATAGRNMGLQVGEYVLENFGRIDPLSEDCDPAYASLVELLEEKTRALGSPSASG